MCKETEEIVGFQVALSKRIINKTQGMCIELQLAVYNNVCTDLRQRRIENEKGSKNGSKPPSPRQLDYAESLGIKTEGLSSYEISKKIDAVKNGGG